MMTDKQLMSDLAVPPGEYLEEVLEEKVISQAELARRMGRPSQAINEIIKGEKEITPETAIQLSDVLGVPAHIWIGLESEYRLVLARNAKIEKAKQEESLLSEFPYTELQKLCLVANTRDRLERVFNLRMFFGVASLLNLNNVKEYGPAFRQNTKKDINHRALASWLRSGHVFADQIKCERYTKEKLLLAIPDIRTITLKTDPNELFPQLKECLASCGVALVLVKHFKKTYTTGATFWLSREKAVIMMSLLGSWADIFWFSLFHELGHVLLHDKRKTFLENGASDPTFVKQENEADKFAQESLIPSSDFLKFKVSGNFSNSKISEFSNKINIAPGIVTGRLQHERLISYTNTFGRIRYKWE